MEAATAAAGGEVASDDAGGLDGSVGGLLCHRRNALANVLDEAVTKVPAGTAVSALARLHSIHGRLQYRLEMHLLLATQSIIFSGLLLGNYINKQKVCR